MRFRFLIIVLCLAMASCSKNKLDYVDKQLSKIQRTPLFNDKEMSDIMTGSIEEGVLGEVKLLSKTTAKFNKRTWKRTKNFDGAFIYSFDATTWKTIELNETRHIDLLFKQKLIPKDQNIEDSTQLLTLNSMSHDDVKSLSKEIGFSKTDNPMVAFDVLASTFAIVKCDKVHFLTLFNVKNKKLVKATACRNRNKPSRITIYKIMQEKDRLYAMTYSQRLAANSSITETKEALAKLIRQYLYTLAGQNSGVCRLDNMTKQCKKVKAASQIYAF